jgi:hypothetical protein
MPFRQLLNHTEVQILGQPLSGSGTALSAFICSGSILTTQRGVPASVLSWMMIARG